MSQERKYEGYVGVFDSGVGGISVLKELVRELPHEDFLFFGDSANAPYGEKTPSQVRALSQAIVDRMLAQGCKAIVIACNTATSASAQMLREEYPDVPIVGVEPALKPAVLAPKHDHVLVMATPITVRLDKYRHLLARWDRDSDVISVPCAGLAARIEKGNLDEPDLIELLEWLVGDYRGKVDSVVLGCTHYPFIKPQIHKVLGDDVPFFDGGAGTARQTRRLLQEKNILNASDAPGDVVLSTSKDTPEERALYQWFFRRDIEG